MDQRLAYAGGFALILAIVIAAVTIDFGGGDGGGGGDCAEAVEELAGGLEDVDSKPELSLDCELGTELVSVDVVEGDGEEVASGDTAEFDYLGVTLEGGSEFDASWDRGEPFSTAIGTGSVIPGWDEGIPGMKVGGRRVLVIPSDLAYGPAGSPPDIGPDEALVFVVDLRSVN